MDPQRIGRYVVLGPVGQGGMGTVYRARDEVLGRVVALKTLRARDDEGTPSADRRRRFEREARAAASLNHPHIATLFDFGEVDVGGVPTLFLAMEYVEGEDLSARLRDHGDEPLEPDQALALAEQICSALQAAHAAGIVHRDLKPSNVRITLDGRVKVLDFGIAKVMEDTPTARLDGGDSSDPPTRSGVILGTLGYLAPEQLRGRPLDGRADLFSLGAILFEMLAGEPAFPNGSVAEYLLAIERDPRPTIPNAVRERVPGAEEVLSRLLARSPEDRYPSAIEARRAIEELREELRPTIPATPAARLRRAAPWLAAATAMLLAGWGAWWLAERRIDVASGPAPLRLAVMPFLNETGDPDQEALALGLGFFLSSRLRGLPGIDVLASSRVAGYPPTPDGEARLVDQEAVDRLVHGRLASTADGLELAIDVRDARAGRSMIVETFGAGPDDPLALQEAAFSSLAKALVRDPAPLRLTTDSNQAYRHYAVAQQFLESQELEDLDAAIHHLEQALGFDQRFAFAHQALADALLRHYNIDYDIATLTRAIAAAENAIAFDPELSEAMRTLARALRTAGRVAEAESWLRRAQRIDGRAVVARPGLERKEIAFEVGEQEEQARALLELGRTQAAAGQAEEARHLMREAIDLAPEWWQGWHVLGVLEMRQGRYDEARAALEAARRLAPGRTEPVENLAVLHLLRGDPAAAIAVYEGYDGPLSDAILASNIGTAYFEAGEIERAEQYYVLATRLQPGNQLLRINLGDALRRLGQESAAIPQYEVAQTLIDERLAAFPTDADLLALRALVAAKLDRCAETVASASELERQLPAGWQRLAWLAMGYALCDRPDDAFRVLGYALRAGGPAALLAGADELASLRGDRRFADLIEQRRTALKDP